MFFSSLDFEYKGKAIFFNRQIFSQLFSLFYEKNYFSDLLSYIMFIYGRNGVYSPVAVADTTPSIALPFDCTAKVMVFFQTTKYFMDYFRYRYKKKMRQRKLHLIDNRKREATALAETQLPFRAVHFPRSSLSWLLVTLD